MKKQLIDNCEQVELDRAYENLANGIIQQAMEDYRKLRNGKKPFVESGTKITMKEIENFFLSEWFTMLTDVDGETLLNRLKRETRKRRKRK